MAICGAGLLASSCALTFWIRDACSLSRAETSRNIIASFGSKVISGQEIQVIGGTTEMASLAGRTQSVGIAITMFRRTTDAQRPISAFSALSAREAQRIHPPEEGRLLEQAEQFEDDYDND